MSSNSTVAALEQKYIELLEKKIARLEAESDSKSKTPGLAKKSSTPALGKKSSATSITAVNGDTIDNAKDKPATNGSTIGDAAKSDSRIRFRKRKYTKEGLPQEEDVESIPTKPDESKPQTNKHALTLLRCFDEKEKYEYSVITIEDKGLRDLLLYVLAHEPNFIHLDTLVLVSQFEPIIHNWSLLSDLTSGEEMNPIVAKVREELKSVDANSALASLKGVGVLEKALSDLKLLLEQVRDTPGLERYFNGIREMQEKAASIAFDFLWTIFPPGELVLSRTFLGQPQLFIVKYCSDYIYTQRRGNDKFWDLECWSYDWNGTNFNRVPVKFTFEDFKGTKPISSLHCYPMKYHRDDSEVETAGADRNTGDLREKILKRGQRYRELCLKPRLKQIFEYDGFAFSRGTGVRKVNKSSQDDDLDSWSSSGRTSRQPHSEGSQAKKQMIKADRVMVDFSSYLQHGPASTDSKFPPMGDLKYVEDDDDACRCGSCMANEKLKENQKLHYDRVTSSDGWEQTQFLICPPRVLGYHLKGKRWVELEVEKITNITNLEDGSSFESLELARPQKNLIKQLVKCHASERNTKERAMTDLMQGKGNGLVILLHGPPGVGKTLTAESVAKATGKPLFSVSVSDIGLKPSEVEHNLEVLFELAATWGAVMLFDEADVFLESRSSNTSNLDRNALVSILLRVLEYYDGILILTTNRIRTFDIAVQSRINFAITFKNLNEEQKKKIYLNFIKQLNTENTHNKQLLLDWPASEDWEEDPPFKKLNGRQIRNVLFSAVSIAQGNRDDRRLKKEHITQILKETNNFQTEINSMIEMARREAEVGFDNH